jgi:hypothetical protein
MNCTKTEQIIVDYIDGILPKEEMNAVQNHLAVCTSCQKVYKETKQLFTAFSEEPIAKPSANLRTSFEQILEQEKEKQTKVVKLAPTNNNSYKSVLQIAASVAILLTGYLFGGYQENKNHQQEIASYQKEQKQLKENMMLAMIDNSSPSKRIKAVNYTEDLTTPDETILKALIERMQQDSNSNVRLTAVEALSKFTDSEIVKTSLIESLTKEKDPSIQIEIIQILVQIQEKRALTPMKKILENSESPDYLKTQVNIGIAKLI